MGMVLCVVARLWVWVRTISGASKAVSTLTQVTTREVGTIPAPRSARAAAKT